MSGTKDGATSCVVCGTTCGGNTKGDRVYCRTREFARSIKGARGSFAHELGGQCPCGVDHLAQRVPPHDLDAEAAVLACVMIVDRGETAIAKVRDVVQPSDFYAEAHRRIFEAALEVHAKGNHTDPVHIGNWLKDNDRIAQVGGMSYLTGLLNAAPAVARPEAYAKIVADKARARAAIDAARRVVAQGYLTGDAAIVDVAVRELVKVATPKDTTIKILYGKELGEPTRDEDIGWKCRAIGIAPGRPTVLYGEAGSRKSWLAKAMVLATASDRKLLGRFEFNAKRALYIDNEGGGPTIARMHFQLLARGMGIDVRKLELRLAYVWRPVPAWKTAKDEDALKMLVDGFDLVIVDAWRGTAAGIDENSIAVAVPLDMACSISVATGAAIVFVDHASGKGDQSGANRLRGHSAKRDSSNTMIDVSADDGEPSKVKCTRAQLLPPEDWLKPFKFSLSKRDDGLALVEVDPPERPDNDGPEVFDARIRHVVAVVEMHNGKLSTVPAIAAHMPHGHRKVEKLRAAVIEAGARKLIAKHLVNAEGRPLEGVKINANEGFFFRVRGGQ